MESQDYYKDYYTKHKWELRRKQAIYYLNKKRTGLTCGRCGVNYRKNNERYHLFFCIKKELDE